MLLVFMNRKASVIRHVRGLIRDYRRELHLIYGHSGGVDNSVDVVTRPASDLTVSGQHTDDVQFSGLTKTKN